jgi:hypothetical protein
VQTEYGKVKYDACPGVRWLEHYKHHLITPVIDLGCGSGETVYALRAEGFAADGVDWIDMRNDMMVRDIRQPLSLQGYTSCVCIDVLEHIREEYLPFVMENIVQSERSVISVHTGSSKSDSGMELHLTQKPLAWWDTFLMARLGIWKRIIIEEDVRVIYLCA